MKKSIFIIASLVSISVSGCAFSPVTRPDINANASSITTSQSLKISSDKAMNAAKSTLEALGYEIQSMTPELGQVRTKGRPILIPENCDCGKWNGTDVSGTGTDAIKVTTEALGPDETSFRIADVCGVVFTGRNLHGGITRQETYQCASPWYRRG
jgi:hypothetical protein